MVQGLPLPLLKICDFGYSKAHFMSAPKSKVCAVGLLACWAPWGQTIAKEKAAWLHHMAWDCKLERAALTVAAVRTHTWYIRLAKFTID